jgi:hypothetical protein
VEARNAYKTLVRKFSEKRKRGKPKRLRHNNNKKDLKKPWCGTREWALRPTEGEEFLKQLHDYQVFVS